MATDIVMPRLSDSMEEGTVLRWIKSQGDEVAVGDELVEIETDKANMVYEADTAGTLIEIVAEEGDTLPIGEPIARVGEPGEAPAGDGAGRKPEPADEESEEEPEAEAAPEPEAPEAPTATAEPPIEAPAPPAPAGDGRVKASPIARRIARDRGLDLTALQGSGPGGRIIKADVERAAEAAPTAPEIKAPQEQAPGAVTAGPTPGTSERPETAKGQVEVVELTKLQQTIARRMAESKATAPHFYLEAEVDMSRAVEGRARLKEQMAEGEPVPSFNDMVVKACALALREFPRANGAYRDGRVETYSRVNVGVAVAAREALVVPTVFDADAKGLRQIAAESRALAARVRDGSITPPELSGGTFTVSNLGMYGITNFAAVINPPQAAILAVGSITERPVVRDGENQDTHLPLASQSGASRPMLGANITTAHLMPVNLACDHRILYGADGAEFLARVRALLEEPLSLAL